MIFGCQYSIIHTSVDIHIDIQARISMQGYSEMDIHTINIHKWIPMFLWISVLSYPCFYGYPFGYPWISMDIHALTCYGLSIYRAWCYIDWKSVIFQGISETFSDLECREQRLCVYKNGKVPNCILNLQCLVKEIFSVPCEKERIHSSQAFLPSHQRFFCCNCFVSTRVYLCLCRLWYKGVVSK